jgi:hypothetical protein
MKKPKAIAEFHVLNFDELLLYKIEKLLKKIVMKIDNSAFITLLDNRQYWNFPEIIICTFEIYCREKICIKNVIELMNVKYYERIPNDQNSNPLEIIWDKRYRGEFLLDKNIVRSRFVQIN